MKKIRCAVSILLLAAIMCGCTVTETPDPTEETEETAVEEQVPVRPQDDYYRFINEETIRAAQFKNGSNTAGTAFDQELVDDDVKRIVEEVIRGTDYEAGTEEFLIKTAYEKYLLYDFNNADVPDDLQMMFKQIDEAESVEELIMLDAVLTRDYGAGNIFNLSVGVNYLNSGNNVLTFEPYRAIAGTDFVSLSDSYSPLDNVKDVSIEVMKAMGHENEESVNAGTNLGYMVMDLYNATDMEILECERGYVYFKLYSREQIDQIMTNVDLDAYLGTIGYDLDHCNEFGIYDPSQLQALNDLLVPENLEGLKVSELLKLADRYSEFINKKFYNIGSSDISPDESLERVMNSFGKETDVLYVERCYSAETDEAVVSLCEEIKEGYRGLISNANWLTEGTKEGLLRKLENIVCVTGMDKKRHDTKDYADINCQDYYTFYLDYTRIGIKDDIRSLGEKIDRKDILMPMQVVNACYDPSLNNITITAAITIKPFYDKDADHYTNLGALGTVIAHEIGHAFDSNGILFDQDGVYDPTWIAPEDIEKLEERNQKAVAYFEDNFSILDVYHVDGEKTLGENFADLSGMECVSSLAKDRESLVKIFESYAKLWSVKRVNTSAMEMLENDTHSPEILRVNAILSTLEVFYETYDVKEGDGMYIAPEKRISRWY